MGSPVLVTGKVLGTIGNVPGPPGGSRGSTKWGHRPRGLHGPSVEGDQPQVGWCAPPPGPKAPRVWGGGASTLLGGQVSPSSLLGRHPRWVLGLPHPLGWEP